MPTDQQHAAPPARARLLADLGLVVALVLVETVYLVQAFRLPSTSPNQADVGPRAYPLLLGSLLVAVTVVLAVRLAVQWTRASGDAVRASAADQDRASGSRPGLIRLGLVVVATVGYLQLVILLGFVVATAVYLAVTAVLIGGIDRYRGRRLALPAAYGIAGAFAIYLLFDQALGVFLPTGLLGR